MSGINPSKDHIKQDRSSATGTVGGSAFSTLDKFESTRHLKYGQTENQKTNPEEKKNPEETSPARHIRRYSASGDSAPRTGHTFMDEFMGGKTGDDLIAKEELLEKDRQRKEQDHI
ncbi:3135_t:CDS:2 [Ambispora gerdemannii]|uniref:3135_t:CDS:1 n=1 Tax=Ambispora gerdemannii TaxID=144530 RepID=A0A9N9A838_9GLOM|nr:3135_t:CDS:2 [Ambispora gerdemannii]